MMKNKMEYIKLGCGQSGEKSCNGKAQALSCPKKMR